MREMASGVRRVSMRESCSGSNANQGTLARATEAVFLTAAVASSVHCNESYPSSFLMGSVTSAK